MDWNSEDIDRLKEMLAAGETMQKIGNELGRSRSAISGKIDRLGLVNPNHHGGPRQPRSKVIRLDRSAIEELQSTALPVQRQVISHKVSKMTARTILKLDNHHCRWPFGDPRSKDFHFCGDPSADMANNVPYCPAHRRKASVKFTAEGS